MITVYILAFCIEKRKKEKINKCDGKVTGKSPCNSFNKSKNNDIRQSDQYWVII